MLPGRNAGVTGIGWQRVIPGWPGNVLPVARRAKKTAGERPVGRPNPPRRERLQDRVKENSDSSVLASAYSKLTLLLRVNKPCGYCWPRTI